MPPVIPDLVSLTVATTWMWLLAATGDAVLDGLRFESSTEAERITLATAVGAGTWGTLLLAMGGVGALSPPLVLLAAVSAVILLRHRMAAVARAVCTLAARARNRLKERPGELVAVIALSLLLGMALLLALAPVTDWDSLMYHLRVPAQFLRHGEIYLPVDNLHATRVGLADLLYVIPLAVGDPVGAAVLTLGLAATLGLAVYAFCERAYDARTGVFTAAAYWGSGMLLVVAATPRVDVQAALFLFLASYLIALEDVKTTPRLALAGILLGFAFATKFVTGPYLVAEGIVVLFVAGPGVKARLRAGTILTCAAVLVTLPWLVRNAVWVGAPFYPLFARPVAQPWIRALVPPGAAMPTLTHSQLNWVWSLRPSFNLRDFILAPQQLSIEAESRLYLASPFLLLLPLLASRRQRVLLLLALPALAFLVALVVAAPHLNLRYLLPGLVPLAVVGAILTDQVVSEYRHGLLRPAVLVLGLLPAAWAVEHQVVRTHAAAYAAGAITRAQYLDDHPDFGELAHATDVIRARVPRRSLVLMLFEARGFRFPRPVLQDNKGTNWAYLVATGATKTCLHETGISYVLVNSGTIQYYQGAGLNTDLLDWNQFPAFARRCLSKVTTTRGFILWRVLSTRRSSALRHAGSNP